MTTDAITRIFDEVLSDRRLLTHLFYRRWESGELAPRELAAYAAQYRHFEVALPEVLEAVIDQLPPGTARQVMEANLADERAVPAPHLALFDDFAAAVGAEPAPPAPGTVALVAGYRSAVAQGPVPALAALAAYEIQAPSIAVSKADGLRARYGLTSEQTRFWDVHGTMDEDHATWIIGALDSLGASAQLVGDAARQAADAWWAFLDERQAESPFPVAC